MGGIDVLILRRDFTLVKKNIDSGASHMHYGKGSYLNMEDAVLATTDYHASPILIFQEGNAVPKGATNSLEKVKWETWYVPMLKGLNREHHGRGLNIDFKKWFNLKTFPFWLIAFVLAIHFLGG